MAKRCFALPRAIDDRLPLWRYPGGTAPRPIKRLSSAAAKESAFSRVFAGAHFRFGLTTRQRLGPDVERFFVQNVLTPLRREDDSDADE